MELEEVTFAYGKPAIIIHSGRSNAVVIGDIHIGIEQRFAKKGIHLYALAEAMAKSIISIAEQFDANSIIIDGDVKDSVLYPERSEQNAIKGFFALLDPYAVTLVLGNHDSHITDITNIKAVNEAIVGDIAIVHGHKWPSEECMNKRYLITAHNHASIIIKDSNNGIYNEKVWLIANVSKEQCSTVYKSFNQKLQLILMPAFNEFITGTSLLELGNGNNINPLIRNSIFDYKAGKVYTLNGDFLGTLGNINAINVKADASHK